MTIATTRTAAPEQRQRILTVRTRLTLHLHKVTWPTSTPQPGGAEILKNPLVTRYLQDGAELLRLHPTASLLAVMVGGALLIRRHRDP